MEHAVISRGRQARQTKRRELLCITSVSYLDTIPDMRLIEPLWHCFQLAAPMQARTPDLEAIEVQVDDRGGVQGQQLAENQAPHDGDPQRPPQLGARACAERQWQAPQQ